MESKLETKNTTVHSTQQVQAVLGPPQASSQVSGNTAADTQPAITIGSVPKAFIPTPRVSIALASTETLLTEYPTGRCRGCGVSNPHGSHPVSQRNSSRYRIISSKYPASAQAPQETLVLCVDFGGDTVCGVGYIGWDFGSSS